MEFNILYQMVHWFFMKELQKVLKKIKSYIYPKNAAWPDKAQRLISNFMMCKLALQKSLRQNTLDAN